MEAGVNVSVVVVIILVLLVIFAILAYCYISHTMNEKVELNAVLMRTRKEVGHLADEKEILLMFPQRLQAIIDNEELGNNEKLQEIIFELDKYRY